MQEQPDDCVLSKGDTAKMLGISQRGVDRLAASGELPVIELSPRRVGFVKGDVKALILSRRRHRGVRAAVETAQERP
jgi:predicted DNA-binding transcriptional regulator AlpA